MKQANKNAKTQVAQRNTKLKWYTVGQTFGKASKEKEFQRSYKEETSRIKIAQAIREARVAKKLTQVALAKRVNMPQSVIARLEGGNHGVSLDTLSKIAHEIGKQVELV